MKRSMPIELVLLEGGLSGDASSEPSRADLRLVRGDRAGDLRAAIEETVAAARTVRREIEQRIARALKDLQPARAPEPEPR
jgi:hypothetical protein